MSYNHISITHQITLTQQSQLTIHSILETHTGIALCQNIVKTSVDSKNSSTP